MDDQTLTTFVESVCKTSHLRVESDLGDGFVRLRSDEAERRQAAHDIRSTEDVVIEMLRNARDAHAKSIFLALKREGIRRSITMIDDGCGIPPALHEQVFEPRVTSKLDTIHVDKWGVHGRGMALYSIAVNADVARVVASNVGKGAALLVETNLDHLGEKTDQSTFPSFEPADSGAWSMRGPRNIIRTTCEFALEHRHECTVYCGSATDVAATLYEYGCAILSPSARAFCADINELPVCKRLATAADPTAFVNIAEMLGLSVSERSARRIMDGTIAPLEPLLERIRAEGFEEAENITSGKTIHRAKALRSDARGLKLTAEDTQELKEGVRVAFADVARRYYLESDVEPEVRVSKDAVRITIPVEKLR